MVVFLLLLFLVVLVKADCVICDSSCGNWSCIQDCQRVIFDKPRCFVDLNSNDMIDSCSELIECNNGVCPADPSKTCGRSMAELSIQCPEGGRYDPDRQVCVVDKRCVCLEGSLEGTNCVLNPSQSCTCPSGQYNSTTQRCETSPPCPSGWTQDGQVCFREPDCVLGCPSGFTLQGDKCVKPAECSCPSGYTEQEGRCVKTVELPPVVEETEEISEEPPPGPNCTPRFFSGTARRCRAGGLTILGASCCRIGGLFASLCKRSEKELKKMREAGLCREIGSYCSKKWKIGPVKICVETSKSYCCFNSELARIINECGRPQIGKGWGEAKHPNCSGFTIEEFTSIDLSRQECMAMIEAWASRHAEHASNKLSSGEIANRAINAVQDWIYNVSR